MEKDIQKLKTARSRFRFAMFVLCIPNLLSLYYLFLAPPFLLLIMGIRAFPILATIIPLSILVKVISRHLNSTKFLEDNQADRRKIKSFVQGAMNTRKIEKAKIAFLCGFAIYLVVTVFCCNLEAKHGGNVINGEFLYIYTIVNMLTLPIGMMIALNAFSKIGATNLSKKKKIFRIIFYVFTMIYFIATSLLILYVCTKMEFLNLCGYIVLDLLLYVLLAKIALCIYAKKPRA